jgi:putative membrane protein
MDAQDPTPPRRFPRSVFGTGAEPDVRFTLANERTFLAWSRTALALIAGGVALEVLVIGMQPGFRLAASLLLIASGACLPVVAWFDWMRTERALRHGRPLPHSPVGLGLVVVIAVVGVLVLCAVLLS